MMKGTIILALLSSLSAVHAKCNKSGHQWGAEIDAANQAIDRFCGDGDALAGPISSGFTKYRCVSLIEGHKQGQFWVSYNGGGSSNVSPEECRVRLKNEVNGCSKGGESWIGNFYYRADPNGGWCT